MAEALARQLGAGVLEASSAGIFPASIIQPETFRALAERQVSLESRGPRAVLEVDGSRVDLLVNMSGYPLAGRLAGFAGREILWRIPDPIGRTVEIYRQTRDQIEQKVLELIRELQAGNPVTPG